MGGNVASQPRTGEGRQAREGETDLAKTLDVRETGVDLLLSIGSLDQHLKIRCDRFEGERLRGGTDQVIISCVL
jgi:hypothetical protein